jgi:hypothetical protein
MSQQFPLSEKPTIEEVKEQIDTWRKTRKVQEPIPPSYGTPRQASADADPSVLASSPKNGDLTIVT